MLQWLNLFGVLGSGSGTGGTVADTPASRTLTLSTSLTSKEKTEVFAEVMDPSEILDFKIDVSNLLAAGESVGNLSVSIPAESVLLGLQFNNGVGYTIDVAGPVITFWLSIADSEQANVAYKSVALLPITVNGITTHGPARRRQRTVAVQVTQR